MKPIDRLRVADRELGPRESLAPGRARATSLAELGAALMTPDRPHEPFVGGLISVARSLAEHFPENIFGDLDHLAAKLWAAGEGAGVHASRIADLDAAFGRHGPVRFRYAHDFLYGFDWARWVVKAPEERRRTGPFDAQFLGYLATRCAELVELIARDDVKYGRLNGSEFRNPFGFSREPDDERRLHLALAEKDLIPVKTWCLACDPSWGPQYAELREATAHSLSIPTRAQRA